MAAAASSESPFSLLPNTDPSGPSPITLMDEERRGSARGSAGRARMPRRGLPTCSLLPGSPEDIMQRLQQQPLPAKSRRRIRLQDTHGGVSTATLAVVEAIELRVLLSAGDPDLAFGIGGIAAFDLGFGS